jgi:hypothetical protein
MRTPRLLVALVLVGGAVSAGCASNAPGDLTAAAVKVLAPEVQHVREVAATHNYAELRAAVAELKALVVQEQNKGQVSASRATAIQDAADVLLQDARPKPKPSPTFTSPSPSPTSQSPTSSPTPTVTTPSVPPTTLPPTPTTTSSASANAASPPAVPSGSASPAG